MAARQHAERAGGLKIRPSGRKLAMSSLFGLLPDPATLLAIELIVAAAAMLQASIGMGFGMLAAPLLALVAPSLVPGTMVVLGALTAFISAGRELPGIVWPEVSVGIVGRIAGSAAAVVLLSAIADLNAFLLVFGVLVAVAVLLSVSGWRLAFSTRNLLALSVISGLMGTITSVGAPPMAILYQHRDVTTARPTLNALFAAGALISGVGLALSGWLGPAEIVTAAVLVPGMFAGFALARAARRLVDRRFRYLALALAFAAALVLIGRGLAAF